MLAPVSGMETELATLILAQYAEEVRQFNYTSDYEPVYQKMVRTRIQQVSEDQRILQKVSAMTVTDKDLENNG